MMRDVKCKGCVVDAVETETVLQPQLTMQLELQSVWRNVAVKERTAAVEKDANPPTVVLTIASI
jgi:hypothetical protein